MSWPLAIICFIAGFAVMHLILNDIFGAKLKESQKELEYQKKKNAKLRLIETFQKFNIEFERQELINMKLQHMMEGHFRGMLR